MSIGKVYLVWQGSYSARGLVGLYYLEPEAQRAAWDNAFPYPNADIETDIELREIGGDRDGAKIELDRKYASPGQLQQLHDLEKARAERAARIEKQAEEERKLKGIRLICEMRHSDGKILAEGETPLNQLVPEITVQAYDLPAIEQDDEPAKVIIAVIGPNTAETRKVFGDLKARALVGLGVA